MFRNPQLIIATAITLLVAPLVGRAQDAGALLDLLVKKKLITDQEAEEVPTPGERFTIPMASPVGSRSNSSISR